MCDYICAHYIAQIGIVQCRQGAVVTKKVLNHLLNSSDVSLILMKILNDFHSYRGVVF